MTAANSWAVAAAKAHAIEAPERAGRGRYRHSLPPTHRRGARGPPPLKPRAFRFSGHSCPAGSKKCRGRLRISAALRARGPLRIGASLAIGRLLSEVRYECQACNPIAVIVLTSPRHRSCGGRSGSERALLARRQRRLEQPGQPQLERRKPGIGLVLDRAKSQLDRWLRGRRDSRPATDLLPGHGAVERHDILLSRGGA